MEVLTFDKFLLIQKFEERIKKDSRSMGLIQTGGKNLTVGHPTVNMMVLASLYMLRMQ